MQLLKADQLPNAIALTCAPGWGHEQLLAEASMALLENTDQRVIEEFAHPDFRWVVPDGAVIKIDQVRRINEFAVQTPQIAPRKVAAISDAHLLNPNSANALLKTLEEPPPNTHIILATPYWGKLLPTIRSRCQRFQVAPDIGQAQNWLETEGVSLSDMEFAEVGYAPLTAQAAVARNSVDLTLWLTALAPDSMAASVEQVLDTDVVLWLGRWYRRLLMHLQAQPIPNCTASPQALIGFADDVLNARRQIETSNAANVRLHLEELIVRWLQLQRTGRA